MSSDFDGLPGCQIRVNLFYHIAQFAAQIAQPLFHLGRPVHRLFQDTDLAFQFENRLLERQRRLRAAHTFPSAGLRPTLSISP